MNDKPDRPPESFIDRMRRSGAVKTGETEESIPDLLSFDVRMDEQATDDAGERLRKREPRSDRLIDSSAGESGQASPDAQSNAQPTRDSGVSDATASELRMPAEARRVLVSLMRQGVVLASKKAKVFEALVRHEAPIREHLAEVYLRLVLDERAGVAFVASYASEHGQGESAEEGLLEDLDEDPDGSSLISRRTLSLYDTLLLLVLRKHYQDREVAGEQRIIIDTERIEAALVPFLPLTNSERSDRRKLSSALTRMVEKRLLTRVRGSDERFEITPVIRYVVSAEFLESLLQEYVRLAGKESGGEADPSQSSLIDSDERDRT